MSNSNTDFFRAAVRYFGSVEDYEGGPKARFFRVGPWYYLNVDPELKQQAESFCEEVGEDLRDVKIFGRKVHQFRCLDRETCAELLDTFSALRSNDS